jgi:flagellar motility protein MotE (MotC chaperone)
LKNVILYALIFIIAFAATTIGIYTYNNKYVNMFEFDFRDAKKVAIADSLAINENNIVEPSDSLVAVNEHEEKAKELKKEFKQTKVELDQTSNELSKKEKELEFLKKQLEVKKNEEHDEWLKSTIKLYEEMETNKAGQLLKTIPENEAREIVYSMKKKKAAEILSNLDTETVKRLTKAQK